MTRRWANSELEQLSWMSYVTGPVHKLSARFQRIGWKPWSTDLDGRGRRWTASQHRLTRRQAFRESLPARCVVDRELGRGSRAVVTAVGVCFWVSLYRESTA